MMMMMMMMMTMMTMMTMMILICLIDWLIDWLIEWLMMNEGMMMMMMIIIIIIIRISSKDDMGVIMENSIQILQILRVKWIYDDQNRIKEAPICVRIYDPYPPWN